MEEQSAAASRGSRDAGVPSLAGWRASAGYALFLLVLTSTSAQLDIAIVPYLAGHIQRDLSITDTQLSLLLGVSFSLFYTIVGVPIAMLIDRWSRRRILAIAIATWSVGTGLCGVAQNFAQLFAARFVVGAGEGVNGPASYSMIGDIFPRERLPRAIALYHLGQVLGPALALLGSSFLLAAFLNMAPIAMPWGEVRGWQLIFWLVGLPGLLVSFLMAATLEEPKRRVLPEHHDSAAEPGAAPPASLVADYAAAIRYMAKHRAVYAPLFLQLLFTALAMGSAQWTPIFYQRTYGWEPALLARYSSFISFLVVPLGMWVGVVVAERLVKRGANDAAYRAFWYGRLLQLPSVVSTLMPNPWLALLMSATGLFAVGINGPAQNAALQAITPPQYRAKITSLFLFLLYVVGFALSPIIVGVLTDHVFRDPAMIRWSIFVPLAVFMPLGVIAAWAGLRPYDREVVRLRALERAAGQRA